jgi:hypothetical protein
MSGATFDIKNDGAGELLLYLEPEGSEFAIPPLQSVQVRLIGSTNPFEMHSSLDSRGRMCISLWPDKGGYEVFYRGKNVFDLL